MRILLSLLILAATFLRAAEPTNSPAPLSVGCQAFTFNRFTVYEAIEKTAEAGGTVIEFISETV